MTENLGAAGRQIARRVLMRHAGPAPDAAAVAAAASRAYEDFSRVLAPVIGDVGVAAMTDRALHLSTREYAWLPVREPGTADTPFPRALEVLGRQDPLLAADAAAAILGTIVSLLATFIGDPLAVRLVRQAWPGAFSGADTQET